MWKNNDVLLSDREISLMLNSALSGVVILDGPSGCGKTSIINTIKSPSKVILSAELVNLCIERTRNTDTSAFLLVKRELDGHDVVCLEDIDMMLSGKLATTEMIQYIIKEKSGECLIVITGIDIKKRVPGFAEAVGAEYYIYF